jgi:hypothetical protein
MEEIIMSFDIAGLKANLKDIAPRILTLRGYL